MASQKRPRPQPQRNPDPAPGPDADTPSDVRGWWRERPPELVSPHSPNVKADDSYCRLVVAELDAAGVKVELDQTGKRKLTGPVRSLSRETVESVKAHGDAIISYLAKLGRLTLPPYRPPMPNPGTVVLWLCHSTGDFKVTAAEDMPVDDWVRWRYRNAHKWYAYSGDTWEE